MKVSLSSLVGVAVGLVALPSFAEPSATDRSLAQSLFDQGKAQMDVGNYAVACPKLQESQRLDPGGGTLMNLALCHEQQGKLASAWTEFKEALGIARRDERQDRVSAAEDHISALEPKLPYLTLLVPSATSDEEVKLDGAAIGRAAWGSPLPVDPGVHELSASAPGRKPWANSFSVSLSKKLTQSVPDLEALPPGEAAPAGAGTTPPVQGETPPPPAPTAHGSSAAGWVVGGLGVVGIGVGSVFGLQALSKRKDSDKLCPTDSSCTGAGAKYNDQAYTNAWISDVGFGVGILGLGIGTVLLLTSSGSSDSASAAQAKHAPLSADVRSLPGGGAVNVSGSF